MGNNLLHTKSSEAPSYSNLLSKKSKESIFKDIKRLEDLELENLQRLMPGATSIDHFFNELRTIFEKNKQDMACLDKFSSTSIVQLVADAFGKNVEGKEAKDIEITIQINNKDIENKANKILKNLGLGKLVSGSNENEFKIGAGLNDKQLIIILKEFANLNNRKFDPTSMDVRHLKSYIIDKHKPEEYLTFGNIDTLEQYFNRKITIDPSKAPMKYKAEDLRGKTEVTNKQLNDAMKEIYSFIKYNLLNGASPQLLESFRICWLNNINPRVKETYSKFMMGASDTALHTTFGEFRGALILEYIHQLFDGKNPGPIGAKISDSLNHKEQLKADVTFLNGVGLQVKNYSDFNNIVDINTTLVKVANYGIFAKVNDVYDFFANYYFNTSFQENFNSEFENFQNTLSEDYFLEIASLQKDMEIDDSVLFYYMGNNSLIPAHAIYESYLIDNRAGAFKISNSATYTEVSSDEEFSETLINTTENSHPVSNRKNPLYYWRKIGGRNSNNWKNSVQNTMAWSNLVNNVRINGQFNMRALRQTYKF